MESGGRNLAFVVVQHLDPDHKSMLPQLLSRATPLPVILITNGTTVAPGRIYVIPENATLTIKDGVLQLTPLVEREQRAPIDTFFHLACGGSEGERGVRHSLGRKFFSATMVRPHAPAGMTLF